MMFDFVLTIGSWTIAVACGGFVAFLFGRDVLGYWGDGD
jgi:hypothetical protein